VAFDFNKSIDSLNLIAPAHVLTWPATTVDGNPLEKLLEVIDAIGRDKFGRRYHRMGRAR
jgi:hypothetical protein